VQRLGGVADEEMFRAFNMGIGFCLVVAPDGADRTRRLLEERGLAVHVLGRATEDPERTITLRARSLVGRAGRFVPA
jgi:phosphoribosylformylglycinamidine cyclo-ligase